ERGLVGLRHDRRPVALDRRQHVPGAPGFARLRLVHRAVGRWKRRRPSLRGRPAFGPAVLSAGRRAPPPWSRPSPCPWPVPGRAPLRRSRAATALASVIRRLLPVPAVMALVFGLLVPSSGASFNARNANPGNAYALTALYAPSGLTATPSGHDVGLAWSAGTN